MCHRHYRAFCIVVVAAGVADFVVVDSVVVVVSVMFLLARFLCLFLCLRVRFAPQVGISAVVLGAESFREADLELTQHNLKPDLAFAGAISISGAPQAGFARTLSLSLSLSLPILSVV